LTEQANGCLLAIALSGGKPTDHFSAKDTVGGPQMCRASQGL
jgi:hypothetical protein